MKNFKELLLEKLFETDNWTYLYSDHQDYSKFVIVYSKKDLTKNKTQVKKEWHSKYNENINDQSLELILCNLGDKKLGTIIEKIGIMIENKEITINKMMELFIGHVDNTAERVSRVAKEYNITI